MKPTISNLKHLAYYPFETYQLSFEPDFKYLEVVHKWTGEGERFLLEGQSAPRIVVRDGNYEIGAGKMVACTCYETLLDPMEGLTITEKDGTLTVIGVIDIRDTGRVLLEGSFDLTKGGVIVRNLAGDSNEVLISIECLEQAGILSKIVYRFEPS